VSFSCRSADWVEVVKFEEIFSLISNSNLSMEVALTPSGRTGLTVLAYSAGSWFATDDLGQIGQLDGSPLGLSGVNTAITGFAMNAAGDLYAVAHEENVGIFEHPSNQVKDLMFGRSDLELRHLAFAGSHL